MHFHGLGETFEEKLTGHYHFKEHEKVLKYQIFMLMVLMILASLIIAPMGLLRLMEQNPLQASADFTFVAILLLCFHLLRRRKEFFKSIARFVIASALVTVLALMFTKPDSFAPVIWISTTIYLMFFLLNKAEAWRWLGIVIVAMTTLYFSGAGLLRFSHSELFIVMGNILLLALVLTWYEKIKEDNELQYRQNAVILQREIDRRTQELQQSNNRLEELNSTLEQRVEEEIVKNREKERIMLAQSRQAAMGDMISMIAHQWRQPITAIGMSAQNMQLDIELEAIDPQRFGNKLQNIVEQTRYLSRTIDDFRNFLRPNKKAVSCTPKNLAEGAVSIIGKSLEHHKITLEKRYETDLPVTTYCNEVIQVLLNVINNAKDIIVINNQKNGVITLRVYAEGDDACFEIRDNAGGIPEAVLPHIFEPYFSTKESRGGTGLGLYISQMIIEKHLNGSIRAENSGGGARFTVSIPRQPHREASS